MSIIVHFRIAFSTRIISGLFHATVISVWIDFPRHADDQQLYTCTTYLNFPVHASCTIPNILFWQHYRVFFCIVSVPTTNSKAFVPFLVYLFILSLLTGLPLSSSSTAHLSIPNFIPMSSEQLQTVCLSDLSI